MKRPVLRTVLQAVLLCIAAVLLLHFLIYLPFLVLRGLSVKTVVMTLDSPNGTYSAQVISSDQGALGGATIVEVYQSQSFLGRHKKVSRVYTGKYGEHKTMDIHWKDDTCLIINGIEYPIK